MLESDKFQKALKSLDKYIDFSPYSVINGYNLFVCKYNKQVNALITPDAKVLLEHCHNIFKSLLNSKGSLYHFLVCRKDMDNVNDSLIGKCYVNGFTEAYNYCYWKEKSHEDVDYQKYSEDLKFGTLASVDDCREFAITLGKKEGFLFYPKSRICIQSKLKVIAAITNDIRSHAQISIQSKLNVITAKNRTEDVGSLSNSDKTEKKTENETESGSQTIYNININKISQTNNQCNNIVILNNNCDKNSQEECPPTEEYNSDSVRTQNKLTNGNVIGVNPDKNDIKEECEFSTSKFEDLLNDKIKNKKEVTINIREWLLTQLPKSGTKKTVRGETLAYLIIALEEMEAFSKDISIDACWSAIQELKVPIVLSRMIQVKYHDLNETKRNFKDKTETKNKDLPKFRSVINGIKSEISHWLIF